MMILSGAFAGTNDNAATEPPPGESIMCLAVPMQIREMTEFQCVCEARGVEREVSLFMLQGEDLAVGDHVLVHVGYAIQKVSPQDAEKTWELLEEMLAAEV